MSVQKHIPFLLVLSMVIMSGCSTADAHSLPSDFIFILDARSPVKQTAQNINIQINAEGEGRYERYNTGGVTHQDENGMVIYEHNQVVETGKFKLHDDQLEQLWQVINENGFFQLTEDYRMAIGYSYAFIVIEADSRRHQVYNIGMEVPEIRAIVEQVSSMLPKSVILDYEEGFVP